MVPVHGPEDEEIDKVNCVDTNGEYRDRFSQKGNIRKGLRDFNLGHRGLVTDVGDMGASITRLTIESQTNKRCVTQGTLIYGQKKRDHWGLESCLVPLS